MSGEIIKLKVAVGERQLTVKGRVAWALDNLVRAGEGGCTPIDHPGPRWADYVFKLRRGGVGVRTITEKHAGAFSGHHARYILTTPVEVLDREVKP